MTQIYKYIKIVWIKENAYQDLYNTLNMRRKKCEYDTDTRIISLDKILVLNHLGRV